jgi:hypothetical protein
MRSNWEGESQIGRKIYNNNALLESTVIVVTHLQIYHQILTFWNFLSVIYVVMKVLYPLFLFIVLGLITQDTRNTMFMGY